MLDLARFQAGRESGAQEAELLRRRAKTVLQWIISRPSEQVTSLASKPACKTQQAVLTTLGHDDWCQVNIAVFSHMHLLQAILSLYPSLEQREFHNAERRTMLLCDTNPHQPPSFTTHKIEL